MYFFLFDLGLKGFFSVYKHEQSDSLHRGWKEDRGWLDAEAVSAATGDDDERRTVFKALKNKPTSSSEHIYN